MTYIAWLTFLSLCLLSPIAATGLQDNDDDDFPFTTVIDLLWKNVEFSSFLRVLQKNGLIPYLNELNNFTLLAPLNSAFADSQREFNLNEYLLHDYVLDPSKYGVGVHVLTTNDSSPTLLEKMDDGTWRIDTVPALEESLYPTMQNAALHSLSSFMPSIPHYRDLLSESTHNFTYLSKLLEVTKADISGAWDNVTVILPNDEAFRDQFNLLELNYLMNQVSDEYEEERSSKPTKARKKDQLSLLRKLVVPGIFGGIMSDTITPNLDDGLLLFTSREEGSIISVNGSTALESNLLHSTGLAHVFSGLSFLAADIIFTAEKYLLGLGADRFVEEVRMRNLEHLIDGSFGSNLIIFVPHEPSNEGSGYSKSSILYHFSDASIDFDRDFKDAPFTRLYDSMFCSSNKRLGGQCQRLKIEKRLKSGKTEFYLNGKYRLRDARPIQVGKVAIFVVEKELDLPGDILSSINPFAGCAKSLSCLNELNLLDLKPNNKGYTIFLPCFNSWNSLALNHDYLQRNITALNLLMKNYILEGLIYTDGPAQVIQTSNLNDQTVEVEIPSQNSNQKQLAINVSTIRGPILLEKNMDTFFDRGVVHPIEHVYFPDSLDITLQNLLETTQSFDFLEFLQKFQEFDDLLYRDQKYSILVPTSKSLLLEDVNFDSTNLKDFLKLHIVYSNSTGALFDGTGEIHTLYGEPLTCRETSSNMHLLRLKNGLDKEVRILKKGCTSLGNNNCVFLIDRPISLTWLDQERYRIGLPGVAFAVGVLLGILGIFSILTCALTFFVKRREAVGSTSELPYSDQERVLRPSSGPQPSGYSAIPRDPVSTAPRSQQSANVKRSRNPTFANSYSINSSCDPVSIQNTSS